MRKYIVLVLALCIAGCATTKKQAGNTDLEQLSSQVRQLQDELRQKDEEIVVLHSQLESPGRRSPVAAGTGAGRDSRKSSANIQKALKNANCYSGRIDGKIGDRTREAVRKFQKENGLAADGVVGEKTWQKLKAYL